MFSKHSLTPMVAAAVILTLALASPAVAQQRRASAQVGANCSGGIGALFNEIEPVALDQEEVDEVLYLLEEEKLARDVYLTLAKKWQLPIFSNIARAEQKHMDAVYKLVEIYELDDPITDDAIGSFTNPDLDDLFDQLVSQGEGSLIDALTVGATIEDMDLADLYHLINEVTVNDHILLVANNLAKGSRNHLRAFMRALEAQDATYSPQYLEPDVFNEILDAEMERRVVYGADGEPIAECGGGAAGFGQRRGQGAHRGNGSNSDNGTDSGPHGSGSGECDGTGSADGGNGPGTGDCDDTGPHGGGGN